jgi:putative copper resistance protein D
MLFTAGLWRLRVADRPGMAQLLRHLRLCPDRRCSGRRSDAQRSGQSAVSGARNGASWQPPYGTLILAKLVMFALMFLLAAHNRFHLVPGLERAATGDAQRKALLALRRSVSLEMLLALAVVWCVAFAGTLDPMGG